VRSLALIPDSSVYVDMENAEVFSEGTLLLREESKITLCEGDVLGVTFRTDGTVAFTVNNRTICKPVPAGGDMLYPFVNVLGKVLTLRC